jgi:dTDP-4-amino-4,6-dideoxygalactose transaminase
MRPHHRPCPNAELAGRELLSLPMDPLMTAAEVDRVCDEVAALVTA